MIILSFVLMIIVAMALFAINETAGYIATSIVFTLLGCYVGSLIIG